MGVIKGDTRSLDNGSYGTSRLTVLWFRIQGYMAEVICSIVKISLPEGRLRVDMGVPIIV